MGISQHFIMGHAKAAHEAAVPGSALPPPPARNRAASRRFTTVRVRCFVFVGLVRGRVVWSVARPRSHPSFKLRFRSRSAREARAASSMRTREAVPVPAACLCPRRLPPGAPRSSRGALQSLAHATQSLAGASPHATPCGFTSLGADRTHERKSES